MPRHKKTRTLRTFIVLLYLDQGSYYEVSEWFGREEDRWLNLVYYSIEPTCKSTTRKSSVHENCPWSRLGKTIPRSSLKTVSLMRTHSLKSFDRFSVFSEALFTVQIVLSLVAAGKMEPEDIIQTPQSQLERIAHISHEECNNLLLHVSKLLYNQQACSVLQVRCFSTVWFCCCAFSQAVWFCTGFVFQAIWFLNSSSVCSGDYICILVGWASGQRMICKICFPLLSFWQFKKLEKEKEKLPLGCSIIDDFLHGGFPMRGIVEVTGTFWSGVISDRSRRSWHREDPICSASAI